MKKKKNSEKVVPTKNYVILVIVGIITVLLTFYINAWIKTYKDNLYSESVLSGKVKEVNITELKEPFYEVDEVILYVGYTNDKELYSSEKKLYKSIKKEDLMDEVMYLNVTNESDYINILEKRFGNDNVKIQKAPLLIYISNGETKKIINVRDFEDLTNNFQNLVEEYNIGKDSY